MPFSLEGDIKRPDQVGTDLAEDIEVAPNRYGIHISIHMLCGVMTFHNTGRYMIKVQFKQYRKNSKFLHLALVFKALNMQHPVQYLILPSTPKIGRAN